MIFGIKIKYEIQFKVLITLTQSPLLQTQKKNLKSTEMRRLTKNTKD